MSERVWHSSLAMGHLQSGGLSGQNQRWNKETLPLGIHAR